MELDNIFSFHSINQIEKNDLALITTALFLNDKADIITYHDTFNLYRDKEKVTIVSFKYGKLVTTIDCINKIFDGDRNLFEIIVRRDSFLIESKIELVQN